MIFPKVSTTFSRAAFASSNVITSSTTNSTKLPSKSGTHILLIHAGQPRTPFYTREYLTKSWGNYKIPKIFRQ